MRLWSGPWNRLSRVPRFWSPRGPTRADCTSADCAARPGGRAVNLGGSTGPAYFRPKGAGFEARHITVEDCTFVGSSAPVCFVGIDAAVVRYNTIYQPERYVLRILQESRGDFGLRPESPVRNAGARGG